MQRYAIGIEFCGTQYRGWQTQQAGVVSVQETIEKGTQLKSPTSPCHSCMLLDGLMLACACNQYGRTFRYRRPFVPERGWLRGSK